MFMKGEQPHCGFPEKNYEAYAERLARAGHRVVREEEHMRGTAGVLLRFRICSAARREATRS